MFHQPCSQDALGQDVRHAAPAGHAGQARGAPQRVRDMSRKSTTKSSYGLQVLVGGPSAITQDAKVTVFAGLLVCLRTVQLVRGAYAENIHSPPVARPVATAESRAVPVVNFALLLSRQAFLLKGLSKGEKLLMPIPQNR